MHIYDHFNKSRVKNTVLAALKLRIGKSRRVLVRTFTRALAAVSPRRVAPPSTHSAILFPSSRLGGCELAVKTTRPPLVSFMALDFWPLLSPHSGSGSLGTHAALSPSCRLEGWGHTSLPLKYKIKLIFGNTIAG